MCKADVLRSLPRTIHARGAVLRIEVGGAGRAEGEPARTRARVTFGPVRSITFVRCAFREYRAHLSIPEGRGRRPASWARGDRRLRLLAGFRGTFEGAVESGALFNDGHPESDGARRPPGGHSREVFRPRPGSR